MWRVLIEMVHGLRVMHNLNVLHRDLKSANVYLSKPQIKNDRTADQSVLTTQLEQGQYLYTARLGDMNVSKILDAQTDPNECREQTGTPFYAAPEVWRDEPYTQKSDIYSLGCIVYEMLALRPPFVASDMNTLRSKVAQGNFPRIPSHFSADIWSIVQMMLQGAPELRPSCEQLCESAYFKAYSQKLIKLDIADEQFSIMTTAENAFAQR